MRYYFAIILLAVLYSCSTEKRVTKQAKTYVDILASDAFHGRGYTHDGLHKAEEYLIQEYKRIGLEPVYPNYQQAVSYPINIIRSSDVKINNAPMIFGQDYITTPYVESNNFTENTFLIAQSLLDRTMADDKMIFKTMARNKGKIPVLDYRNVADSTKTTLDGLANFLDREKTLYDFPALILIKEKLTHSLANTQDNFCILQTTQDIKDNDIIAVDIKSQLQPNFKSHNIVGKIAGTQGDSAIFITAHYDHLGQVNQTIFSGANDNASGTSMLLTLARYFKKHPIDHDIYFYAFTGEEAGLQGSLVAADEPPLPLEKIKFLINLDIVGTGDDGVRIVNSTIFEKEYDLINQINQKENLLPHIKSRGVACNSDHCPFYSKGVPSFFIYTLGGIDAYHDPLDKPDTLPLTEFYDLYILLAKFITQL